MVRGDHAEVLWQGYKPEPIRGDRGYNEIANASNIWLDKQNPDLLAPPSTDIGKVANAKWPFSVRVFLYDQLFSLSDRNTSYRTIA